MNTPCDHVRLAREVTASANGCEDCLSNGGTWVHLRICMTCGHVGCCDSSPGQHATGHWHRHRDHPLVRSFEPGENWWWCYPDALIFRVPGAAPAPSYPPEG